MHKAWRERPVLGGSTSESPPHGEWIKPTLHQDDRISIAVLGDRGVLSVVILTLSELKSVLTAIREQAITLYGEDGAQDFP